MFGRKPKLIEAQAEILDAGKQLEPPKLVDGYAFAPFEYLVEVRIPGELPRRTAARGLACTGCRPEPGDVLAVKCEPQGAATFELDADERYAPVAVARQQQQAAVDKDALFGRLEESGARGTATIVAVRAGRHRFANVETFSDVRVVPKSGEPFDATIVEWISESFPQFVPVVGQKRRVVFDPADRALIDWNED